MNLALVEHATEKAQGGISNMGLKFDLLLFGGIAAFLISQRDRIGEAFGSTGEFLGQSFNTGFSSFFDSFTFGKPISNEQASASLKVEGEDFNIDPTAQGAITQDEASGATTILQDESGVFVDGEKIRDIDQTNIFGIKPVFGDDGKIQEGSTLGTIGESLSKIFNPLPEANADSEVFEPAPGEPLPKDSEIISKESLGIMDTIKTMLTKNQPTVTNLLPEDKNFNIGIAEGSNVQFGIIRENPIDTFSEVLKFFPELTASQAADFLRETEGKIIPSQVDLIDADIKNIVAGVEGGGMDQAIQVSSDPLGVLSIREQENQRAACFTCEQFGLNCAICNGA